MRTTSITKLCSLGIVGKKVGRTIILELLNGTWWILNEDVYEIKHQLEIQEIINN